MAESAVRAGYPVVAIDAYGDLDLAAIAPVVALRGSRHFDARAAARASRSVRVSAVAYLSNFENDPAAVRSLAVGRELLGNRPPTLARARDSRLVARILSHEGIAAPAVRASPPPPQSGSRNGTGHQRQWLVKPRRSGGGHGVRSWVPGSPVPRHSLVQERIRGRLGSIIFVADGRDAVAFALTRQLAGERAFGARGFLYCGSILVPGGDGYFAGADDALLARAIRLARVLTRELGLIGVNGIDFVERGGEPWAIEVNPRFTASMELAERAYGVSVFALHAAACRGVLPALDLSRLRRRSRGAAGKAVLYARRAVTVADTRRWLSDRSVSDVPPAGSRIARGRPICTIFAREATTAACHQSLVRRAAALYSEVENAGGGGDARE